VGHGTDGGGITNCLCLVLYSHGVNILTDFFHFGDNNCLEGKFYD
jgi:hypothetical protein